MRGRRRAVMALIAVVGVSACASEATAPREPRAGVRSSAGVRLDNLEEDPDSLGNCRAGWVVANGRCVPG